MHLFYFVFYIVHFLCIIFSPSLSFEIVKEVVERWALFALVKVRKDRCLPCLAGYREKGRQRVDLDGDWKEGTDWYFPFLFFLREKHVTGTFYPPWLLKEVTVAISKQKIHRGKERLCKDNDLDSCSR